MFFFFLAKIGEFQDTISIHTITHTYGNRGKQIEFIFKLI